MMAHNYAFAIERDMQLHEQSPLSVNKSLANSLSHAAPFKTVEPKSPVAFLQTFFPATKRRFLRQDSSDCEASYTTDMVGAIRHGDIDSLREMLEEGVDFDGRNRNGESLLHLACRRGNADVVEFLLRDARMNPDVVDDMGRSILHDVCWRPSPSLALMDVVLDQVSPTLLLTEDARGHTPLDYARKHDWAEWTAYLTSKQPMLEKRLALCF